MVEMKRIRKSRFGNINQANALLYFSYVGMVNVTVKFLEINPIRI